MQQQNTQLQEFTHSVFMGEKMEKSRGNNKKKKKRKKKKKV